MNCQLIRTGSTTSASSAKLDLECALRIQDEGVFGYSENSDFFPLA